MLKKIDQAKYELEYKKLFILIESISHIHGRGEYTQ